MVLVDCVVEVELDVVVELVEVEREVEVDCVIEVLDEVVVELVEVLWLVEVEVEVVSVFLVL